MKFEGYGGRSFKAATIRRVWALVSRAPGLSGAQVARLLKVSRSTAYGCLSVLQEAGYIESQGRRAWAVHIPLAARIVTAPAHPGVNATEAR